MADLVDMAEIDTLRDMLRHLQSANMLPGSWDKRFVSDIWQRDPATLTENQRNNVRRLVKKYRRQMPAHLVGHHG
jgi:hypothetical protein